MDQATSVTTAGVRRLPRRPAARPDGPPRPHLGRLAVLVLVLIGASFYVSPLRDFFAQQDRYEKAAATLASAKAQNAAYEREVQLLTTKAYIAQRARADSMLVPPGTQVFVIKGLPGRDQEAAAGTGAATVPRPLSVPERLRDLWRTLLH